MPTAADGPTSVNRCCKKSTLVNVVSDGRGDTDASTDGWQGAAQRPLQVACSYHGFGAAQTSIGNSVVIALPVGFAEQLVRRVVAQLGHAVMNHVAVGNLPANKLRIQHSI